MTPLWFFHGFLGLPSMWRDVHRALGEPVAESTILPGHGPEPWFPPPPQDFASAVDAIASSLPFSDAAIVVGYSMGARIALALTLGHPHLVKGAVLVGVDPGIERDAEREDRRRWEDEWASRALSLDAGAFADAWAELPIFESQRDLPVDVKARLRTQRSSHTPRGVAWAMRALGTGRMPSLWSEMALGRAPLTIITGARDVKFTEKSRAICDRSKSARHIIAEGSGHNVVLEAPEVVARAIEEIRKGS